jgi:asparagine synthase (glutamine-hydrolysing)
LVSLDPSPQGQAGFWLLGNVPEPHTWFKDINSIEAGTWTKIFSDGKIQTSKYWDIADSWRNAPAVTQTREHVQSVVRKAVSESVKKHLISDVPVGVFLSGGIDSGAIAGLVQDTGFQNMKGITVSFAEFANKHEDESPIAAFVSKKYGFQHHVRQVTKEEFEADLPRILAAMDQPSLDGINTWYATKAVKELGLKVVLSGVGGDELFYGYPSFSQIPKLVKNMNIAHKIPAATSVIDLLMSAKSKRSNNLRWNYLSQAGRSFFGAYWLRRGVYTPEQLGELMGTELAHEALKEFEIEDLIKSQTGSLSADAGASVGQMESMIYLRNQLLRDSDWASMDHSVELRTPLVDAWLLRDLAAVLRSFNTYRGKELLANSPKYPLDQFIIDRKKTGFGIPLGLWLKTAATKNDYNVTQGGDESRKWAKLVTQSLYQKF